MIARDFSLSFVFYTSIRKHKREKCVQCDVCIITSRTKFVEHRQWIYRRPVSCQTEASVDEDTARQGNQRCRLRWHPAREPLAHPEVYGTVTLVNLGLLEQ